MNVHDLIRECVELQERKARSGRRVTIRTKLNPIESVSIEADPTQLKEVICNLLDNAADATGESGGIIEVDTVGGETLVEIHIRDNGSGIAEEDLDRVFEPFFTTKTKGTGLGLAVCRQIIALHNGTIGIKSAPGRGTDVHLALPRVSALRSAA